MAKFFLATLSTVTLFIAGGCSKPALVYGERNSLHVASVQINDNVAEPLRLNVAFRRTIAMKAPALEDEKGDAVSVFSSFDLNSDDGKANTIIDPIEITTKFASGNAARNIASKPQVVAEILKVQLAAPDSGDLDRRRKAAQECVSQLTPQQIAVVSALPVLQLPLNKRDADGVRSQIAGLSDEQLKTLTTSLKPYCASL